MVDGKYYTKKLTKNQIIDYLIHISHELDWAYFWDDAERRKKAADELEKIKHLVGWHGRVNKKM